MSLVVTDSQQVRFERGFKSWAENSALTIRSGLGLRHVDPLEGRVLAGDLGVRVWTPHYVPGLARETLEYLVSPEGDEWSALTVRAGRTDLIVLNPAHSLARQNSDLMHELAHIIRNHEPAQILISEGAGVGLRTFNEVQEAEANWLAGCLLLPRAAVAYHLARGMARETLAECFGVSMDLLRYRINVTGLGRQYS